MLHWLMHRYLSQQYDVEADSIAVTVSIQKDGTAYSHRAFKGLQPRYHPLSYYRVKTPVGKSGRGISTPTGQEIDARAPSWTMVQTGTYVDGGYIHQAVGFTPPVPPLEGPIDISMVSAIDGAFDPNHSFKSLAGYSLLHPTKRLSLTIEVPTSDLAAWGEPSYYAKGAQPRRLPGYQCSCYDISSGTIEGWSSRTITLSKPLPGFTYSIPWTPAKLVNHEGQEAQNDHTRTIASSIHSVATDAATLGIVPIISFVTVPR